MTSLHWVLGSLAVVVLVAAGLMLPWFGKVRRKEVLSPFDDEGPFTFPEGFLWGTSTAAQQIESQSPSDWSAFEDAAYAEKKFARTAEGHPQPGHICDLGDVSREVLDKKTDFDARYREDLALMAEMHHNAYRFSISWSRLFPEAGMEEPSAEGIAYYQGQLDCLRAQKLRPSATLFHFSSPAWLWQEKEGKRGWERDDAIAHFERFVKAVAANFGDQIDHWCTLNEPMVVLYMGMLEGLFPPNEQRPEGPIAIAPVVVRLLEAHACAYHLLKADAKARGKEISIGIAKHTRAFEPLRNYAPLDRLSAKFAEEAFVWDFLDAIHTGEYRMTATSFRQHIPNLKGTMDYVGINYYGRLYIQSKLTDPQNFKVLNSAPGDITSDLGWALYPHGFYQVLQRAHQQYQRPIYILENGIADANIDDPLRQHFLVTHLREIVNAIKYAGADVRGFFYWSLMDNFEWAEGFGPRFGLLHVDYDDDFKRTTRQGAQLFSEIIAQNAISTTQWQQHKEYKP